MNIRYSESEFEQYYERFLRVADTKSVVTEQDLAAIFVQCVIQRCQEWRLTILSGFALNTQRGMRHGLKPFLRDQFAGLPANAVGFVGDPDEGGLQLFNELFCRAASWLSDSFSSEAEPVLQRFVSAARIIRAIVIAGIERSRQ